MPEQHSDTDRNEFVSLAELASKENWCWDLTCTTCGNTHFRLAFRELAKGKSPDDNIWVIHEDRTDYQEELGPTPSRFKYNRREREAVIDICSKASLKDIASRCAFPDWLGYLGLILVNICLDATPSKQLPAPWGEALYERLSKSWATQLIPCVYEWSDIRDKLQIIAQGNGPMLTIKDLQAVEQNFQSVSTI